MRVRIPWLEIRRGRFGARQAAGDSSHRGVALIIPLAVVGASHHTAPVEIRERLAYPGTETLRTLVELRDQAGVAEAVLLSTCNRTELYLHPVRSPRALEVVESHFTGRLAELAAPGQRPFFRAEGTQAVRHLFEVVAGLDSMVLGEAEIQGQVREAYRQASTHDVGRPLTDSTLDRLFQTALSVGGRIRNETSINEGAASVASVAVELARKIFGNLRQKRILILGAGATAELVVDALAREGVRGVLIANRTWERAEELAGRMSGSAVSIEGLADVLPDVDIVLSSTGAPEPVLTRSTFRRAFPQGRPRPLLAIDIAMPRDIDPAVGDEDEVFLYNVDDLHRIVDEQVKTRAGSLPDARRIVAEETEAFRAWYASRQVVPVIRRMREGAEQTRAAELAWLFSRLDELAPEERGRIEEFSRRLMNKLLHQPTVRLRKGMAAGGGTDLVDAVRFLYGLESKAGQDTASGSPANNDEVPGDRDEREGGGDTSGPARSPQHGAVE